MAEDLSEPLWVGTLLYGFTGGYFGRDSYGPKRVEAVGRDWVIARDEMLGPVMARVPHPSKLAQYATREAAEEAGQDYEGPDA